MKTIITILAGLLVSAVGVADPGPDDLNEGSHLEYDDTNSIWRFSWWGVDDRTYFIQHSTTLMEWDYVGIIESGDDDVLEWGFTTTSDRFFLRLQYSDIPTSDPEGADFDGDGVSNLNEVLQITNPLSWSDLEGDGLADDFELFDGSTSVDVKDHPTPALEVFSVYP